MTGLPTTIRAMWLMMLCAMVMAVGGMVGGCATSGDITSEVTSYGSWPQGRKPGRYVFERLPSQQSQSAQQDLLEAAVKPVLAALGFEPAAEGQQSDLSVQLGTMLMPDPRPRYDPYWGGPYTTTGIWLGGFGGGWHGGVGYSMAVVDSPYTLVQVDLLVRDRQTNQVLYETHAKHMQIGQPDVPLYAAMFEAALKDFPYQAVNPRVITIPARPARP